MSEKVSPPPHTHNRSTLASKRAFISIHNSKYSCSRLRSTMFFVFIYWLYVVLCVQHSLNTHHYNTLNIKDNVHHHMCSIHLIQTLRHFVYKAKKALKYSHTFLELIRKRAPEYCIILHCQYQCIQINIYSIHVLSLLLCNAFESFFRHRDA